MGMGLGSDTMKRALDAVPIELTADGRLLLKPSEANKVVEAALEPLKMMIVVAVKVLVCPPGRMDVNMARLAEVEIAKAEDAGPTLSKLVGVDIAVVVCPPVKILVVELSIVALNGGEMIDTNLEDVAAISVFEGLVSDGRSSGWLAVGAFETLKPEEA